MKYVNDKIVGLAYEQDKMLGGVISILSKIGIIGTEVAKQANDVCLFLSKNNVEHDTNGKFLVWVPGINQGLKDLFKRSVA